MGKVEATFSGSNIDDNWRALYASAELVHELGTVLGNKLNFEYPQKQENDVMKYLDEVKSMPRS